LTDVITTLAAIGIDLGDKDARYASLNEEGKFTEEGTVAMTPEGLRKHFAKLPRTRIAIEVGAQSRWIAKTLGEFGHEVIVANPRQVQLISANHSKNGVLARCAARIGSRQNPGSGFADAGGVVAVQKKCGDLADWGWPYGYGQSMRQTFKRTAFLGNFFPEALWQDQKDSQRHGKH
jgi:hypothetical protein